MVEKQHALKRKYVLRNKLRKCELLACELFRATYTHLKYFFDLNSCENRVVFSGKFNSRLRNKENNLRACVVSVFWRKNFLLSSESSIALSSSSLTRRTQKGIVYSERYVINNCFILCVWKKVDVIEHFSSMSYILKTPFGRLPSLLQRLMSFSHWNLTFEFRAGFAMNFAHVFHWIPKAIKFAFN